MMIFDLRIKPYKCWINRSLTIHKLPTLQFVVENIHHVDELKQILKKTLLIKPC